ncbi:hypothetical protein ACLOJK_017975 [Asimina triloba]
MAMLWTVWVRSWRIVRWMKMGFRLQSCRHCWLAGPRHRPPLTSSRCLRSRYRPPGKKTSRRTLLAGSRTLPRCAARTAMEDGFFSDLPLPSRPRRRRRRGDLDVDAASPWIAVRCLAAVASRRRPSLDLGGAAGLGEMISVLRRCIGICAHAMEFGP